MSHPNKIRGGRWEAALVPVLQSVWPGIQRTGSARNQYGDFEDAAMECPFTIEAKDEKTITLSKYLDQVAAAAQRVAEDLGRDTWPVAIVKRRQRGVLQAYVVMEADTFLQMAQTIQDYERDNVEMIARIDELEAS